MYINYFKLHYNHLATKVPEGERFYFLTATFIPFEKLQANANPVSLAKCFRNYERFYVRLLSALMNNYVRKRDLQPLTYAYLDFPFTKKMEEMKRSKDKVAKAVGLSEIAKQSAGSSRLHPEMTAHIHAIMRVAPELVEAFEQVAPGLETLFHSLDRANQTLRVEQLPSKADLRRAVWYSSKLLRNRPAELKGEDLYILLPKAKSEPTYAKTDYEKEEAQRLAADRAFRTRNKDNWRAGYFG